MPLRFFDLQHDFEPRLQNSLTNTTSIHNFTSNMKDTFHPHSKIFKMTVYQTIVCIVLLNSKIRVGRGIFKLFW